MDEEKELGDYYGGLHSHVRMLSRGYTKLVMLDGRGGLGKTYHTKNVLSSEIEREDTEIERSIYQSGFTTPLELYKTLWQAREKDTVLFLDDVSGLTANKALDMLKSATDTDQNHNIVQYQTSSTIDHPTEPERELQQRFVFRGKIVMSFNETPDDAHFDALRDRGEYYRLSLDYDDVSTIITLLAEKEDFSDLTVEKQKDVAEWLVRVTDSSMPVSIRTYVSACAKRHFVENESDVDMSWQEMALDVLPTDGEKALIAHLREQDLSVEEQVERFVEETGLSERTYYRRFDELLE